MPGFGADSRSLNRRGARWPRPPLVSLPTFGSLWAFGPSAHRAHASLRCPKNLLPQHKKRALRVPTGHKKRGSLKHPAFLHNTQSARSPRRGRADSIKNIIIGKTRVCRRSAPRSRSFQPQPAFLAVARNAQRAIPPQRPALPRLPASTRVSRSRSQRSTAHPAAAPRAPTTSCKDPRFSQSLATLDGLCRRKRRRPPLIPASSRVSCSLRSLATLTAFAAAEVFGALPQTPARA